MLRIAKVQTALEALRQSTTSAAIMTREERQRLWTRIARGDDSAEMKDRLKASELLGRSQGDFLDRVDAITRIIVEHRQESIAERDA